MLEIRKMNEDEEKDFMEGRVPGAIEHFAANVSEGFDQSIPGVALNKMRQNFADQAYADPTREAERKKFTKTEWEKSEYFRPGVEFEDGFSEDRARFLAEGFDSREERRRTIEKGNPTGSGFGVRDVTGFVGQMVGGIPDPINLLPMGGVFKGTTIARRVGNAAIGGAVENLAVSAVTRPYWETQGDSESTWGDYASDVFIGGALGGAFGGAGIALRNRGLKRSEFVSAPEVSEVEMRRTRLSLQSRGKLAKAADEAITKTLVGETFDASPYAEDINQLYNISDKERADLISLKREEIELSTGIDPEEANAAASLHVANSVVMARHLGISPQEFMDSNYGAIFQQGEMVGNKIQGIPETTMRLNKLIDDEIDAMAFEVKGAAKEGGGKVFDEGVVTNAVADISTYPEWYGSLGIKNKDHFLEAIESKKGPVYERIRAQAEANLRDGYNSRQSGPMEPSAEYRALKEAPEVESLPVGEDGQPLFQFAGPKAKTAPLDKLNKARLLERDGKDIESIRQETGWFKAPDGKWRFEIDDSQAKFKQININKKRKFKLADVLEHDQLFEAYPELKDINIEFAAHRGLKGGHFSAEKNTIKIMVSQEYLREGATKKSYERLQELMKSPEIAEYKKIAFSDYGPERTKALEDFRQSTIGQEYIGLSMMNLAGKKQFPIDLNTQAEAMNIILHEIQHSIQSVEGFARGGNKKADGGYNNYRNLHGEIEARNTESRRSLSAEERGKEIPATNKSPEAIIRWRGEEVAQDLPPMVDKISEPSGSKGDIFDATPQTLLKKSNKVTRGAIQFADDKRAVISLLKDKNESTILHESAHLFLKNYQRLEASGKAPQAIIDDLNTLREWAAKQPNEKGLDADTQFHEKVARGFEQYLKEGRAPEPGLQGIFDRMKEWLTAIYRNAEDLKVEISPEARKVFDRMIALEKRPELAPAKTMEAPPVRTSEELEAAVASVTDEAIINHSMLNPEERAVLIEGMTALNKEEAELQTLFQSAERAPDDPSQPIDPLIDEFNRNLEAQEAARQRLIEIAAEKKRLKQLAFLNLEKREEVYSKITGLMGQDVDPEKAFLSLLEGGSSLRGIQGAGNSVDAKMNAIGETTSAKAFAKLRALDENIEKLFMDDAQFNENVILEMLYLGRPEKPGRKIDPLAQKAAKIIAEMKEELRQRANLAGADIGKIDGHVSRWHDFEKMLGKGQREKWVQFMKNNLDQTKSYVGLKGQELIDALNDTYDNMTTNEWLSKEAGKFDPLDPLPKSPRNIASKLEQSRELHFTTPEAELAYLKEFGQGRNALGMAVKDIQNYSRRIALMESLGTNPEANLAAVYDKVRQDIRKNPGLDNETKRKKLDNLNFQSVKARESAVGQALMLALGEGSSFAMPRLKYFGSMIRLFNSLSKLGAATLSQFTDFAQIKNEVRLVTGDNAANVWVDTLNNYFKGVSKEVRTQVLDHIATLGDGMNYANFNRFDQDNVNNWVGRMSDKMFKWSGQNWHTNKARSAMALVITKELGKNMDKSFDQLNPNFKAMLSQYGSIDAKRWDMLRKVKAVEIEGMKYYHPGLVDKINAEDFDEFIPDQYKSIHRPETQLDVDGNPKIEDVQRLESWEKERAKFLKREKLRLETDLQTFFLEESRNGVLEPDARVRRLSTFGTKSGTIAGEAARLMMQFKSFSIAYTDRVMGGKRFDANTTSIDQTKGFAGRWGESLKADPSGAIQHVVASLGLAYMSMVAKDLSKGLEPKDPTLGKTWLMAGFQSGGLGIMGDFAQAGISARSGTDALSSLMGPTFSTVSTAIGIAGRTAGLPLTRDPNYAGLADDYTSFARANMPFGSLWYTRAAVNYLVWDRLKESLEPGSIRRSERRLRKEYNQKSLSMSSIGL